MTREIDTEKKLLRLEKRLAREKSARAQAEALLEEKSREIYHLNNKLHEEAKLLEATVINAKDGVIITDADLDNGPHIIYVNEAFTKISGYTKEEIIGKTPRILQGKDTDRETLDRLRNTLKNGQAFQAEIKNYKKDGTAYWLDISIVPVKNNDGATTHFTAIERDITAQKSAQKELREEKEKAEAASIAKSEFLANMSHELRTPMNGIIGMTEFILDSELTEDQRDNAETLHGSSHTLLSLLNDILDISKIEAGELELEEIPFDINIAMQQIIQLFTPIASKKGVDLDIAVHEETPPVIVSDLGRIQQVLRNLLNNALKFTEEGSVKIALETKTNNGSPYLHFAVKDTGIGIAKDKTSTIFEKFTQADTSTTREFGGTGLGLAITQHLVTLMEGDIGVDSILGEGSTFWFSIPLTIAEEGAKPVNLLEKNQSTLNFEISRNIKVLAVDDHPINQKFILKLLKKMGFTHVDLAKDGLEALNMIDENPYDIVLMDCQMPELDGYEATMRLRKKEEGTGKRLPVIALTANAMLGDREKCIKSGMDDYLSKPIKPEKLITLIKKHIAMPDANESTNAAGMSEGDEQEAKSSTSPIDMKYIEMFTDNDPQEEKELLSIFFTEAERSITELTKSHDQMQNSAWKAAAHKMSGAAANLGARHLMTACKEAEKRFEDSQNDKLWMLLNIKEEVQNVRDFFDNRTK